MTNATFKHVPAIFAAVVSAACLLLAAAPAQAQATRTWVSGVGDDANPCSRTAPCKTFAGAISKTATSGEINCLDPGGFGAVTITKSIIIDCHEVLAGILNANTTGININAGGGAVRLRNLIIDGNATGVQGINIIAADTVIIEDMSIEGNTGAAIKDARTTGGHLVITNAFLRKNGGTGVVINSASATATIKATLTDVHSDHNSFGIAADSNATVVARRSSFSNNITVGVDAESGGGGAGAILLDDCIVSNNATAFEQAGSGSIRLNNSDVAFNTALAIGTVQSFTNNRFVDNGGGGTVTPIGSTTNPTGQQ